MLVTVKTLTGKSFAVDVFPTSAVEQLMSKIQDKEGIPPDQQRIVFKGKQLDVGHRLEEYGITNESVVHLVLRLRGGVPEVRPDTQGRRKPTSPQRANTSLRARRKSS